MDQTHGSSRQGFQALRPEENPPFREVPYTCSVQVRALGPVANGQRSYSIPASTVLRAPAAAQLDLEACQVVSVQAQEVCLQGACLPNEGRLQQTFVACTAPELHRAFADFWGPIWQRDGPAPRLDLHDWPDLERILEHFRCELPPTQIRSFAPELWRQAIQRMPRRKATGVCGWAPADLKLLPDQALEVLNHIFHQAVTCGLPTHLLRTRVGVLAKVPVPTSMGHSRPITVFSTLYRIWASVLARQILKSWAPHFPASISGSMPGRACRDTSYRQQHQIECSLVTSTPRVGLSVDIVKCFNQLGWGPICALLLRLGVPEAEVHFWASCLRHHTRCSVFHNDISAGIPCHNGAPEGDPMSVVAMVAVCRLADAVCHHALVDYESYVDNWAWSSADRAALATVIPRALDLLQSLRLPIDFKKSYIWATKRQDRLWWQRSAPTLFPEGCLPALVSEVRDLGVAFKYDGHGHRASRNHRLQSGLDRIDRLRSQPRPPLNKAHLVQAGIWPQCLYGAESHVHTRAELQSLRGRAARAIVGNYAALSPHLTFALLAERVQDPQMYCLERQLALLRRACLYDPDTALSILDMATAPVPPRTAQGPATSLRLSLDRLGLVLTSDGVLKGLDHTRVRLDACQGRELRCCSALGPCMCKTWLPTEMACCRHHRCCWACWRTRASQSYRTYCNKSSSHAELGKSSG